MRNKETTEEERGRRQRRSREVRGQKKERTSNHLFVGEAFSEEIIHRQQTNDFTQ